MKLLCLLGAFLLSFAASAQPPQDLLGKLREGGYVLYMFSKNDANMRSYEAKTFCHKAAEEGQLGG